MLRQFVCCCSCRWRWHLQRASSCLPDSLTYQNVCLCYEDVSTVFSGTKTFPQLCCLEILLQVFNGSSSRFKPNTYDSHLLPTFTQPASAGPEGRICRPKFRRSCHVCCPFVRAATLVTGSGANRTPPLRTTAPSVSFFASLLPKCNTGGDTSSGLTAGRRPPSMQLRLNASIPGTGRTRYLCNGKVRAISRRQTSPGNVRVSQRANQIAACCRAAR